jgi:hypothetical protein
MYIYIHSSIAPVPVEKYLNFINIANSNVKRRLLLRYIRYIPYASVLEWSVTEKDSLEAWE